MLNSAQINSLETVLVDLHRRLENSQIQLILRVVLMKVYFIDYDEYLPQIKFIFVVVTDKLLVNLTSYLPKFTIITVRKVEFSHFSR